MYRILPGILLLLITGACLTGCGNDVESSLDLESREWLVPADEVIDGGPGRDGIPSIDQPLFFEADQVAFLHDTSLVVGVRIGADTRAYPELILDYHEIVNDVVGDLPVAVTYCPLTGSALVWERSTGDGVTTFGVSGLLYNTNLMPYDRATASTWSQMKQQCVNGTRIGQVPEGLHAVETTWKTWREAYPETKVLGRPVNTSAQYGRYPYGSYRSNHNLLLAPISNDDPRLPRKVRVCGVVGNSQTKVYPMDSFGSDIAVIHDTLGDLPLVVVGSNALNFAVIFGRATIQQPRDALTFSPVQDMLPAVVVDQDGSHYDLFGVALDGPRAGQQLIPMNSYIAMWFAWGTFHPGAQIYNP